MHITTFGEIMLRLTASKKQQLIQSSHFEATFGGAEANVAVSLARLGDQVHFVTKLPVNELGDAGIAAVAKFGVNSNDIVRGGDRIGIYFLERGNGIRPSNVVYDRSHSAFADSGESDYDWPAILANTNYFYISGITPALSSKLQATLLAAVKICQARDIKVVYDANFRGKLWSSADAIAFNEQLMPYVNLCFVHDEDIYDSFGIKDAFDGNRRNVIAQKQSFKESMALIADMYPSIHTVASIIRDTYSVEHGKWAALLFQNGHFYESPVYDLTVNAEVAAGDAFGAGMIHGLLHHFAPQDQLDYALAAAALKLTIPGDFNLASDSDIKAIMSSTHRSINR